MMRKHTLLGLLVLLLTGFFSEGMAQQAGSGQRGPVNEMSLIQTSGNWNGGASTLPTKKIQSRPMGPYLQSSGFGTPTGSVFSAPKTTACGPDTVLYPLAKTSAFEILTFSQSVSLGQWYPAPQSVTISGVSFYAWLDSATNQSVNAIVEVYNAGADSLPTGAPLATATVSVDSAFGNGSLAVLLKHATFTTPVTVTGPYVVTLTNPSQINMGGLTNDYTVIPPDGGGEFLSCIEVQTGWISSRNIAFSGTPFDADIMLFPHCSYQLTASFAPNPGFGCTGIPATLLNQSSPILESRFYNIAAFNGTSTDSYTWNYGDGSPEENVFNGVHTYNMIGSYNVVLRDTLFGWTSDCADSLAGSIVVNTGVAVGSNFTFTNTGSTYNFTDASSGSPILWQWDFGDGTISNAQNPSHTYASNGIYTVCLVAANTCGADTICQQVLVGAPPAASCDTFTNFVGIPTIFPLPSGGYISGHNSFLDSAKAEEFSLPGPFAFQEVLYAFGVKSSPTPNTSRVIATVWDATGPGGSPGAVLATQDLFYNAIDTSGNLTSVVFPNIINTTGDFFAGIQLIYAPGDTVALVTNGQGQSIPATGWDLFSGGTTWTPYDSNITWGLQVSNAILVVQTVEANFGQTTAGLSVTLSDSSLGANGWAWDFGDGTTSSMQNPTHTYAAAGTYTVCLVAFNGTCNDSICQTVTVSACTPPTAAFSDSIVGQQVFFTDLSTSPNTGITAWAWDFGDGNTSTLQNPTHTYAAPGVYTVCLTVTDSCSTDSTCQTFLVGCPPPVAAFSETSTLLTVNFTDLSTSGTGITGWLWDFGDGTTSTTQNPTHTYSVQGTYTVCLAVIDSCGADTICQPVTVVCPPPVANWSEIVNGQSVAFTDLSTGTPTSWSWDFGDGTTSNLQNPIKTYNTADTFFVCLAVANICGTDTFCDTVITGCTTPIALFSSTTNGLTFNFTDQSTQSPTAWLWDFGDGNTSTMQNPNYTYLIPGTYVVCLTAINTCGSTTFCDTITAICPVPAAAFTSSSAGLVANFTDLSTSNPNAWFWDFGDGGSSLQQNPSHTYSQAGTYTVCLVAGNACGQDTICQQVTIVCPTPGTAFSFTSNNQSYTFTDLSTGNPTSWFWDFGDGSTSAAQNPTHVYQSLGTFQVCLVAINSCGPDTICQNVTVTCPQPAPAFNFTTNQLDVNFTDLTGGVVTNWQWDFGDGNASIQQSPTHTYAAPGSYLVCLTSLNSCGGDSVCATVNVSCTPPSTAFNFLTVGNVVDFTDLTTGGATSWFWDFGDGSTSTMQNPTYTYSAVGTYTVCLITASVCGEDTVCQPVIINCVPPSAGFNSSVSNDSVVAFSNTSSANSTAWFWDFGDGNTSTDIQPTHIYQAPGTYTVCQIVTNQCGSDTTCSTVEITCQNPTAGFLAQVQNSQATFSDNSIGAVSYFWDFGDGTTSTDATPVHSFTATGVYQVCLTVTNFCGSNTSCQNLVITCNPPMADFSFLNGTNTVQFTDQTLNLPTSWFWDFGDGGTDTVQNPVHGFLFSGQFFVCLRVENACGVMDTCKFVTVTAVNVTEAQEIENSFRVFPNPSSGIFQVEATLPQGLTTGLRVVNLLGQEVLTIADGKQTGAYQRELDLRELGAGSYLLEFQAGPHVIRRQLVIE